MAMSTARYGKTDHTIVGLADNAKGVPFRCGTCEYFEDGVCHNKNPKLDGRSVKPEWCCNLYEHDGMKIVVK